MKLQYSILLGIILTVIVGFLLAAESDDQLYTPPREITFTDSANGFFGRPMTPQEITTVGRALDSIRTAPPDSIRWTDAAGSTKTVSCSTFAALVDSQLSRGQVETDVSSRKGKDHGHSAVQPNSDGRATDRDQLNVDSQLIWWATWDSTWLKYLEETLIHEGTHKWQSTSVMSTDEEEIDALEAELAYKDSIGLDMSDGFYREKWYLRNMHWTSHMVGQPAGGSALVYNMGGIYWGYLRHNVDGTNVDWLVTNGPSGYDVNEYPLNLHGVLHAADMVTFIDPPMFPGHCLAVTCGGNGLGTASINLLDILEGELVQSVWDYQFGPAQGWDPMFFYCMTSWDPTEKWYVIDSTGHQILTMIDAQMADGVPDEIVGTYASAFWPGFEPLHEMRSIQATTHPEMGFGLIVRDLDKGMSDVSYAYDEYFFLPEAVARTDSAAACVPVSHYEFLTFTPDIQYPLPWAEEDFVQIWGTWQHRINVWTTDASGELMMDQLGSIEMLGGVDGECSLSRDLVAGEWLVAVDDVTGARLRRPTEVFDPTIDDLTINFDANDSMLKVQGKAKVGAVHYDLYSSSDGVTFFATGDQSITNYFEFPPPLDDIQFYRVKAIR